MRAGSRLVAAVAILVATSHTAIAQTGSNAALAEARRLYDELKYEAAVRMLDPLIVAWQAIPSPDAETRSNLVAALELRGRARFGVADAEGARSDFTALLTLDPAFAPPSRVNPRILALFNDLRKRLVGQLLVKVTPGDAQVDVDGRTLAVDPAGTSILVLAGSHTVTAKRPGHKTAVESVSVGAGGAQEVTLALARVGAVLTLATSPARVEVVVDGRSRGRTEVGALPQAYADWPARLGVGADAVSAPFVIDDLMAGKHTLQLRRDCYAMVERAIEIETLSDVVPGPFLLERAVGTISVASTAGAASVYLDGEQKGASPYTIADVCEGNHIVELRTPYGRYQKKVRLKSGDKLIVQGDPKPVIALLDVVGLPDGYRGSDARVAVENAFAQSGRCAVLAPPGDQVQQALKAEALTPGWLSFDGWRRPIGNPAAAVTAQGRQEVSARLARSLDAQAVAELTLKPGGGGYYLALLAAGSREPDVFDLVLEEPSSVAAAMARLDRDLPLYQPSVGLSVADVADGSAPVVVGVDAGSSSAKAGIVPGDLVIAAGNEGTKDAASFLAVLAKQHSDGRLAIDVKDRSGASRRAELQVSMAPRLIAMTNQSFAPNALLLSLRAALAQLPERGDASVVRLNLAVLLMRLGNYAEALDQIRGVQLPPGPGISSGTVQYLKGLCYEGLGERAEAERAFRAASTLEGQLTEDGPAVKELAEIKLGKLVR